MTSGETHTGWKAIAKRLGVRDIDTAKRRVKRFKIPVVKMGNAVALDEAVYRTWYANFAKITQENDVFQSPIKNTQKTPKLPPKLRDRMNIERFDK